MARAGRPSSASFNATRSCSGGRFSSRAFALNKLHRGPQVVDVGGTASVLLDGNAKLEKRLVGSRTLRVVDASFGSLVRPRRHLECCSCFHR